MKHMSLLPLTEASFYILISLIEPLHGYGVIQKVEKMSSGRVKLGPGTLYGALNNLTKQGLIQRVGKESGRRKNYHVTSEGFELIELELKRLKELTINAERVLADNGGEYKNEEKNE